VSYSATFSYFVFRNMNSACKNCDHPLDLSFIFCPACGQKTATRRLRMTEILHDFWTQFTDIDKGFFTLLRDLVLRPGIVAREYIGGKRRKHFGPLNFYLIVGTALIVSMNITEWIHANGQGTQHASTAQHKSSDGVTEKSDQVTALQSEASDKVGAPNALERESKIPERRQAVSNFWSQYSDIVALAAAPFLCLFFWLFYRRAGFNYTELLVACLYMIGFTNLVYALVVSPATSAFSSSSRMTYALSGLFKVFEVCYFTYFYFQLTQGKVHRPLLRAAISSVMVAVCWTTLTFALVAGYMMTGFGLD
jgi:hypothetical protein